MAALSSRQDLIDYCLRRLGFPVIEINVDEDQISDRIDDALQFWYEYHFDGRQKTFISHKITGDTVNLASALTGNYIVGETLTGLTSGATTVIKEIESLNRFITEDTKGTFVASENVRGSISNYSAALHATTFFTAGDMSNKYISIGNGVLFITRMFNFGGAATSTTYFKNSGSLGAGVNTNNHGVLSTSISYSVTVTYGAGTVVLNDNLGNPDATGQIAAGSTSRSLTISPYTNKYFGTSVSNSIDDATLRAGTNEVASGKAKSNFTIPISSGTNYIFYAYPASLGALSSISVEGFGSLDAFTLTTRNVTNASGYSQSYNIYISNNNFASSVNNIIIN